MKANSLLFNLFIIAGLPLLNTSCGLTESMTRGHCMEATDGYQVCVKSDQVKCKAIEDNPGSYRCSAFGSISSPISGEKRHWSSSKEEGSQGSDSIFCSRGSSWWSNVIGNDSTSFTCSAAAHHGKL